jgi:hypothetical protein
VGVDQLRSANDIQPEKIEARHKVLILRGTFFRFWSIFALIGQFRRFFGPDFSFFRFFRSPRDGILARKSRPCTTAHQKKVLKQDVRPHPLSNNFWEHQVAHFWHDFTLRRIEVVERRPYLEKPLSQG